MRESVVKAYQIEAEAAAREERHGLRINGGQGRAWHPTTDPDGFRAYVLAGKYHRHAVISWETNALGRKVWMHDGMHRVYLAARAELKAGRDLSSTVIARLANVSQGYVSKCLRWLEQFNFIVILGVFRGRWGRIVAKLRSIIPTVSREGSTYVGMIRAEPAWRADSWASWERAEQRIRFQL